MLDSLPTAHVVPSFCPRDGTPLGEELKAGKLRQVCPTCGWIYGRDPRVVVGLLIGQGDALLLVERDSAEGKRWSLPLYRYDDLLADPRVVAARHFEEESGQRVEDAAVADTFTIRDTALGPVLVLLYRASLADIPAGSAVRFADPRSADRPSLDGLTRGVVDRVAASLPPTPDADL